MTTFYVMNSTQYKRAVNKFANSDIGEKFEEYAYNAILRTVNGDDPTHLNALINGARNVGRYRYTKSLIEKIGLHRCFAGDIASGFPPHQKKDAKQKKAMARVRNTWESDLMSAMMAGADDGVKMPRKNSASTNWTLESVDKRVSKIAAELREHGIDPAEYFGRKVSEFAPKKSNVISLEERNQKLINQA